MILSAAVLLAFWALPARAGIADDALAAREAGRLTDARALWAKACEADGSDGFAWSQLGWSELAVAHRREAIAAFTKAADRAASNAIQAEASLGLGLAFLLNDQPRQAQAPLRRASVSPYAAAAAARLTSETALAAGDKTAALVDLRRALELDPFDREALRLLAAFLDKTGDRYSAWRAARRALMMDPQDVDMRRVLKRVARRLSGDRDAILGLRRLARPLLDPQATTLSATSPTRTIRIGLYGAPDGRPATMTGCLLAANSAFRVEGSSDAARAAGDAGQARRLEFSSESGRVDVRDGTRHLLFSSSAPFRFVPSAPSGSVLVATASVVAEQGVDLGDREVRGAVAVFPDVRGFTLIEEVPLEPYLYGVVSLALPDGSPPEAYKAEAVVARTAAVWASEHRSDSAGRFDLLDDDTVQRTIGVTGELRSAVEAVAATEGLALARGGRVAPAPQHEDSGGWTEDAAAAGVAELAGVVSVSDTAKAAEPPSTPLALERFLHDPPQDLFSAAAPTGVAAASRWVRVIDARELSGRAARRRGLGRLLGVRVVERTPTGRVKALVVVGSRGTVVYSGFEDVQALLSPGSLRSTLFSLQPINRGDRLERLVVFGAGTGSGLGFSRAGAVGQANMDAGWRDIVRRYFPGFEIAPLSSLSSTAAARKK